jgi:hypothetical protein
VPGARRLTIVVFAAIWIVSACASAVSAPQTSPTVQPSTDASVTVAPTLELPSIGPSRAPEPAATTRPTAPEPTERGDQPNLVILKFEVEEDPVAVGSPATLTATVANIGPVDAGPFFIEIVDTRAGQGDLVLESKAVDDGLAAGDLTELTTSITPNDVADMTFVARADLINSVPEQNESDNERVLEIEVKSLGNIRVPADGFTVTPHPDAPGTYLFYFTYVNTGPSTLVATVPFKFFAYTDAGVYVEWGSHDLDLDLAPNASQTIVVAYPVAPGTYRAYVLADSENSLEESDEDDNEGSFDFTAP